LEAEAVLVSGYLLFAPGSLEAGVEAIQRARARVVAVDAASWLLRQMGREAFFESTHGATLLLANERETEALGGPQELRRRYPMSCVKLGAAGAELTVKEGATFRTSVKDVDAAVDPTGAGDAFDGVLLAALARNEDPESALRRAGAAGARVAATGTSWP